MAVKVMVNSLRTIMPDEDRLSCGAVSHSVSFAPIPQDPRLGNLGELEMEGVVIHELWVASWNAPFQPGLKWQVNCP